MSDLPARRFKFIALYRIQTGVNDMSNSHYSVTSQAYVECYNVVLALARHFYVPS